MHMRYYKVVGGAPLAAIEARLAAYTEMLNRIRAFQVSVGAYSLYGEQGQMFEQIEVQGVAFSGKPAAGFVRKKDDPPGVYRPATHTALGKTLQRQMDALRLDKPTEIYTACKVTGDGPAAAYNAIARTAEGAWVLTVGVTDRDTPAPAVDGLEPIKTSEYFALMGD